QTRSSLFFTKSLTNLRRWEYSRSCALCRNGSGSWTAKQHEGDLEAFASSTYELQRKLVQAALSADSSGGVQSSFSLVSPTSAVCQVVLVVDSLLEELHRVEVEVVRVTLQLPLRKMKRRKKNQKRKETLDSISLVKMEIVTWEVLV
ncbi:PREDICTED: uncharacterized protein LOC104722368, partial [Camelina sativa]|uniref:Uncharacterized protein LOC104722368 n=1 Tax=Camelina sativa TaxID=90675 RepID=A0ABM1QKQ5_CAMSA